MSAAVDPTRGPDLGGVVCPTCRAPVAARPGGVACAAGHAFEDRDGIVAFAPDVAETDDGYDPVFFAQLAEVEAENFWFKNRNRLIVRSLVDFFPGGGQLLEIGCGTGFVLQGIQRAVPAWRLYASELHVEGMRFAQSRVPEATFFQVDARNLPFDRKFDVIGAFDVIEHIEEDEAVLASMHAAIRPGGGLLLTVPQHAWLWSEVDTVSGHKRRYEEAELHDKVRAAGFEILRSTSFVTLLLPAFWLQRVVGNKADTDHADVMKQFEISRGLNAALSGILRVEQALLRAGLSLPVGSSRLLVARRLPSP